MISSPKNFNRGGAGDAPAAVRVKATDPHRQPVQYDVQENDSGRGQRRTV